jgi:hypothetical protein
MNTHTPKWAPILGVGVPVDSWIFKEWLQGSKPIGLGSSLYHWKTLKTYMFKVLSHEPFGHLKQKLWPKERSGVKLAISLPTTKSRESTIFLCLQVTCDIPLKPHLNRRSAHKVMRPQSHKSPNFGNFGTPIGRPRTKCHLDVGFVERHRIYYKGEGGGFLQVPVVVNLVSPSLLVAHPSTKNAPTMH